VPQTDDWYEKLRCPKCRKTGMASVAQVKGKKPSVECVPEGFKVVKTQSGPDFRCETCGIAAQ
jgi:hypothetical protein